MFAKTVLENDLVRLEQLTRAHEAGLAAAIADGELWNLHVTLVPRPEAMDAFFARAEREFNDGDGLTFVTIDKHSNRIAGSTRFLKANPTHKRVEIGYTFLGAAWQKTRINTAAKLLMLEHAFDELGMNRVEFLTDYLNIRSQEALRRLGAREEGLLRNHMVMPDGRIRDSVIFSVIASEWPGVRQHLVRKLADAAD